MLNSSRLPIARALVALISTSINPETGLPLLEIVKLGNIFDPKNYLSWCEVTFFRGEGGPEGSGGDLVGWRIDDAVTFLVTCGFGPYQADSTSAEVAMLLSQDVVLPLLRTHFQLPDMSNPSQAVQSVYRILVQQSDTAHIARFPNGNTYKLWNFSVLINQQYNVELVQP